MRARRWPRRILIGTNVMVALALVGVAAGFGYVQFQLGRISRHPVAGLAREGSRAKGSQSPIDGTSTPPFTLLVVGSDSRALGTSVFGSQASNPGQRSDSIILVRVIPRTRQLALLSIPRDTLVHVPGYGLDRINVAFNGGPSLLVKVLSEDFGIQVNHVAQFNFNTFQDIDNAIGGVYQWFPGPAKDLVSNLYIPKGGCVLLTGGQALAFARSREYEYSTGPYSFYPQLFPESDIGRIQRQQDFVRLAAAKIKRVALTSPFALNSLITSLTHDVQLDTGFSNSLIVTLARDFRSANLSSIPSFTYPTANVADAGTLSPDVALGRQIISQWLAVTPVAPPTTAEASTTTTSTTLAPTTTTTTSVRPGSVVIQVINGSGVTNQATLVSNDLSRLGYQTRIDGLTQGGHVRTVIDYAPDALAAGRQLAHQLIGGAVLTEDSTLTPTPYNLRVLTGRTYAGLSSTGSGSTTVPVGTTTSTSSTTLAPQTSVAFVGTSQVEVDSSSFYHGRYIPPGRRPGQIPATCPT